MLLVLLLVIAEAVQKSTDTAQEIELRLRGENSAGRRGATGRATHQSLHAAGARYMAALRSNRACSEALRSRLLPCSCAAAHHLELSERRLGRRRRGPRVRALFLLQLLLPPPQAAHLERRRGGAQGAVPAILFGKM